MVAIVKLYSVFIKICFLFLQRFGESGHHGQTAPVLSSYRTEPVNVKPQIAKDQLMKKWSAMKIAVCNYLILMYVCGQKIFIVLTK